jgi:hypothetical protein
MALHVVVMERGSEWVVVRSSQVLAEEFHGTCPRTSPEVEQETVMVLRERPKSVRPTVCSPSMASRPMVPALQQNQTSMCCLGLGGAVAED